jgi:S-adenosylmethionine:tRNA ribosyltransferase-isomerase
MLVARRGDEQLVHSTFALLPAFLEPGDLVVVNTSATIPAAVTGRAADGIPVVLHLSTALDDGRWVVEPRQPAGRGTTRWEGRPPASPVDLPGGGSARFEGPYLGSDRLLVAALDLPAPVLSWLAVHGRPIRYGYVDRDWPIDAYRNVYATEPGSAEMPSAGRPFTTEVITRLAAKGVGVSPVVLHTGVASLESDELPYPERVLVPATTAERVNLAHAGGHRVIAVGTTVVRALETAAGQLGVLRPYDGWSDLVVTPARGVRAVDGLLTGWHEPEASHLLLLEAIAGRELLERSYAAALDEGYKWHEFGDVHLLLR